MRKHTAPSSHRLSTSAAIPQAARHAVFENCQNITVSGGVFNVQGSTHELDENDFRHVRLGDLNLLKEVAIQNVVECRDVLHKRTGMVKRRDPVIVGVRKIHRAHVIGMQEDFTAIVYEGSDFEKHRAHAEQREGFKHPSLIQLFGVTSSTRLKALIYNDGLMPLDAFRKIHQQSPLMSAYVESEFSRHLDAALRHWDEVTRIWLLVPDSYGFRTQLEIGTILWIRISTGQLCIEVNDNEEQDHTMLPVVTVERREKYLSQEVHLASDTNLEEKLLSNMSLNDIHYIFSVSGWWRPIQITDPGTILLGSLSWPTASCAHLFNPFSEVSLSDSLGLPDVVEDRWEYIQGSSIPNKGHVTLPNGWIRIALADLPIHGECHLRNTIYLTWEAGQEIRKTWLSQVNHILEKSGVSADEYYLISSLSLRFSISSNLDEFTLQRTFMTDSTTDNVYLFLFPVNIDDSGGHLAVRLPPEHETYYWSFDPAGNEHLPPDALDKLTLPNVSFQAHIFATQWRQEVYNSIGEVHHAKGFDLASQDVAIELGYPLLDVDRLNNLISGGKIEVVDEVEVQEREL